MLISLIFALTASASDLHWPSGFLFGLATAPAHVEDSLHDRWEEWADAGKVAAFPADERPKERLRFWSEPEREIALAAGTGAGLFRLGVDWGRLVPELPGSDRCGPAPCASGVQDREALAQYKKIIGLVREKKMRVMLTLFHHSGPRWFKESGGWLNPKTKEWFRDFSLSVMRELGPEVDYWITLNEPTVYGLLTYVNGAWPDGGGSAGGLPSMLNFGFWRGSYARALHEMAQAHRMVYAAAKAAEPKTTIGFAHHFSYLISPQGERGWLIRFADSIWTWSFPDAIRDSLDFMGMNYYGAEHFRLFSQALLPEVEYSEAGRAIHPRGFYELLKSTSARYGLPIHVTENGVADAMDWLRPAYLTEHLAALHQAMSEGVSVRSYVFWTISDNWEWADGYCPKFGLVAVDRTRSDLRRMPRPSYGLFSAIASSRTLTQAQRDSAWRLVQDRVGQPRPFCRAEDGVGALHEPVPRKVLPLDWRFRP